MKVFGKRITLSVIGLVATLFMLAGFVSTTYASKYVTVFKMYDENIFTKETSNYRYTKEWVPDHHYLKYTNHGFHNGGWNYIVREVHYIWGE